jgi:uncharacterized membrane protein YphA (DoxX/SURF4 family)
MDRGKQIAAILARVVVGALFIYAGFSKASDPGQFIRDIWNYQLLPESVAYWIAAYLPYLEIFAGIALITGFQRNGARLLVFGMLIVFVTMLISAWARGLDISCGCFGPTSADTRANYPVLLARNVLLAAGLLFEAWAEKKTLSPTTTATGGGKSLPDNVN